MTQFLSSFSSSNYMNSNYFGGHYGPVSDFNKLQSFTLSNLANYVDGYKTAADTYPNEFDTIERISAGYLMNTMDFGRLHVVAGSALKARRWIRAAITSALSSGK